MTKQQTDSSILYRRNEMGFVHEIECIHHVLLFKTNAMISPTTTTKRRNTNNRDKSF